MRDLEKVDESLLRRMVAGHSKTALELLYLEFGLVPIRFLLMDGWMIMFLNYILNQEEETLVRDFYDAQSKKPVKGDWTITVKKDLEILDIKEDIENISAERLKKVLKAAINKKAYEYLMDKREEHSKSKVLQYDSLKMQSYLKADSDTTIKDKCFFFRARTQTLDVKCNFKHGQKSLSCTSCGKADETQRHLLECEALSSNSVVTSLPVYEDLFGCDHDKIRNIGVILSEKFTLFKLKPSALSLLQLCAAGGSNQQLAGDLSSV